MLERRNTRRRRVLAEGGDQLARNGAGFAVSDEPPVELDGGDDFGGGAGEEDLIGVVACNG